MQFLGPSIPNRTNLTARDANSTPPCDVFPHFIKFSWINFPHFNSRTTSVLEDVTARLGPPDLTIVVESLVSLLMLMMMKTPNLGWWCPAADGHAGVLSNGRSSSAHPFNRTRTVVDSELRSGRTGCLQPLSHTCPAINSTVSIWSLASFNLIHYNSIRKGRACASEIETGNGRLSVGCGARFPPGCRQCDPVVRFAGSASSAKTFESSTNWLALKVSFHYHLNKSPTLMKLDSDSFDLIFVRNLSNQFQTSSSPITTIDGPTSSTAVSSTQPASEPATAAITTAAATRRRFGW